MSSQRELDAFVQRHPALLVLFGLAFLLAGVGLVLLDEAPRGHSQAWANYVVGPIGIVFGAAVLVLGAVRLARGRRP